jgi:Na+-transporting methylmalonyl-CoA/oxaloacetate decarboxylase gamma subunit
MRKVLLILAVVLVSGMATRTAAQGIGNVRINEVLVQNENNYEDDYGHRSSWIELFNSGHEMVNVSSCYIVVTRADGSEVRYMIPDGDPATVMHANTYLVFFCEGTETKGTFYTNFTLEGVEKITLYNADGKSVLDEFSVERSAQTADVSVGLMSADGISEPVVMTLPRTTPNATNETIAVVPQSEMFRQRDPYGIVMAIVAMAVVLSALTIIFLIVKTFGKTMISMQERKAAKLVAEAAPVQVKHRPATEQVQEEIAAIALALKLYQEEQHILESTVITINRVSRVYSPWSSKIHGITSMPR